MKKMHYHSFPLDYVFANFDKICHACLVVIPDRQREGGEYLEILTSFLIAVMAGVACHYIIKWLDGDNHDN